MNIQTYKKLSLLVICFILLFQGVLLRGIEVLNKNYLWGFDHGRDYLLTYDIVVNHNARLIGTPLGAGSAGIQGIFHGPGYYYFLTIPFILFGGDPYGGVVLMFVFGVAALALSFILGKKMYGMIGGLIVVVLHAISPPLIAQSRSIWNSHPTTPFIILSFLFTYLMCVATKRKLLYAFLASFFAGFIYNFELAIAVPMSVGLVFYSFFIFKKSFKNYLALVFGFVVAYLPMALFDIRHNFMMVSGIFQYIFHRSHSKSDLSYVQNIVDHFWAFLFNLSNTFPQQTLISGTMILLIFTVSFVFLINKEKNKDLRMFVTYLFSLPIISFVILSFLRNAVYPYYLVHLNVCYILLFVYFLLTFQKRYIPGKILFTFLLIFFAYAFMQKSIGVIQYDLKDYGGDAKIRGKQDAFDYIYKDAKGEKFGLFVFSPPVYTYPYDYLAQWYGKSKYGYLPSASKDGLFYLLIEVDGSKPWSYKGWQQTVIKTGDVVSTKKLPSGLIVEKRVSK